MSAEATSWAWSHGHTVEGSGQLLVLLALAEHATPDGESFPNRRTIARMCGFSPKPSGQGNVTKHMNALEALGLIAKAPRFEAEKAGRQTSNIYQLQLQQSGSTPSGAVATPPVSPGPPPPGAPSKPLEPTASNQTTNQQTVGEDVKEVYGHFLTIFKPDTAPKLGPSLIRQIEKGLKEYDATALCRAVEGLREWRKQKPGKETLGAIFDTYPGGKPLTEQIAFFISRAKGSTGVGRSFPSADRAIVAEKQRLVQRGHRLQQNEEAVKQAKEAEAWLREHGIGTTLKPDGHPVFAPLAAPDADAGSAS
jgi:hypothetical protein